ncbi:LGFP repeat-containing protein [Rhodococcus sp. WB9]|uniref:LGFP repeat-containing protein n=1 Tax=Rhodococcus sp. WB9 TaxID=2594007 RepID=UPI0021B4C5A9|nr:hypothetical protein [Rhodococcus sp. WB9]
MVNHFLAKWGNYGYEGGFIKYPTSDEIVNPDGVGRRQHFQGADIYWNFAPGAHVIGGAIRDKWNTVGAERNDSLLGYPTTDEMGLPDGQGRMNRFERGVIYWSPANGAHPITGLIQDQWERSGYEQGRFGYPINDQYVMDGGVAQDFQRETIFGFNVIVPIAGPQQPTEHIFTPHSQDFAGVDRYGAFDAGVDYDVSTTYKMYWSFVVAPQLRAIATSNKMTCKAWGLQDGRASGYHDNHVDVPMDYGWHSTIPEHTPGSNYLLAGNCNFPVNAGGKNGEANVGFRFQYEIWTD